MTHSNQIFPYKNPYKKILYKWFEHYFFSVLNLYRLIKPSIQCNARNHNKFNFKKLTGNCDELPCPHITHNVDFCVCVCYVYFTLILGHSFHFIPFYLFIHQVIIIFIFHMISHSLRSQIRANTSRNIHRLWNAIMINVPSINCESIFIAWTFCA